MMNNRKFFLWLLLTVFFCLFCIGCLSTDPQTGFMIEQPREGGRTEMFFYLDIPFNIKASE